MVGTVILIVVMALVVVLGRYLTSYNWQQKVEFE